MKVGPPSYNNYVGRRRGRAHYHLLYYHITLCFDVCLGSTVSLGTGNVKGFEVRALMAVAAASIVNILATLRVEDLSSFGFFRECPRQIFYFRP
jgi:hypothetical protein